MSSFYRVLEQLDEHMALRSEPDPKAIAAVRAGVNLDPEFWDQFLKLCNNPALPALLGVRRDVISLWPSKIRENLSHIEAMDSQEAAYKKANLITTGY